MALVPVELFVEVLQFLVLDEVEKSRYVCTIWNQIILSNISSKTLNQARRISFLYIEYEPEINVEFYINGEINTKARTYNLSYAHDEFDIYSKDPRMLEVLLDSVVYCTKITCKSEDDENFLGELASLFRWALNGKFILSGKVLIESTISIGNGYYLRSPYLIPCLEEFFTTIEPEEFEKMSFKKDQEKKDEIFMGGPFKY